MILAKLFRGLLAEYWFSITSLCASEDVVVEARSVRGFACSLWESTMRQTKLSESVETSKRRMVPCDNNG